MIPTTRVRALALAFAATALVASAASGAERRTFDADDLVITNLVGQIRVQEAAGSRFEVEVDVQGRDAERHGPEIVAREGRRARLEIRFPVERERRYVYPDMGWGSTTIEVPRDDHERESWLGSLLRAVAGERIRISRDGSGVEVWADVTVHVPRDARLKVVHGVGRIDASEIAGDLDLRVKSGRIDAERVAGRLLFDTGSGNVHVSEARGELTVDTGSGNVTVNRYEGPRLLVDTGSGNVDLNEVRARFLEVDTGSGSVRAAEVRAEGCVIDTGSGSVVLALHEMGEGDYDIDTGSGSITMLLPAFASAEVDADTGSGGIHVDLADFKTLYRERDAMRFKVGSGAARVRLDTGSGRIRVANVD